MSGLFHAVCGGLRAIEGEYVAGEGYILMAFNPLGAALAARGVDGEEAPGYVGMLQAIDPVAGERAWGVTTATGNNVPVFTTAGGLVFQGGQQWVVEGLHKQMLDQFSHGLAAAAMG